jgi:small-conductance mechanosensitive channel
MQIVSYTACMAIDTYFGNTPLEYAVALLIFAITVLAAMVAKKAFIMYSARFAKKSRTLIDDAVVAMANTINPPFYWFASFVFALQYLTIDAGLQSIINKIFLVWVILQAIFALQIFIDFVISEKVIPGAKAQSSMVTGILSGMIKIALWLIAGLFVLSNLGVNITSLVAGLGIGGIAIALAAQNILGDLFSSLAIYFDRPFAMGDYIVVGTNSGTVQKIGIKSTRIRALSGEEISIPNKDIAAARISNFKRMQERRATITIAVPYGTDAKTLAKIPSLLEASLEGIEDATFMSGFLAHMGASAILFELVFVVHNSDYDLYRMAKQDILLNIISQFGKHKISLVAPGKK